MKNIIIASLLLVLLAFPSFAAQKIEATLENGDTIIFPQGRAIGEPVEVIGRDGKEKAAPDGLWRFTMKDGAKAEARIKDAKVAP